MQLLYLVFFVHVNVFSVMVVLDVKLSVQEQQSRALKLQKKKKQLFRLAEHY